MQKESEIKAGTQELTSDSAQTEAKNLQTRRLETRIVVHTHTGEVVIVPGGQRAGVTSEAGLPEAFSSQPVGT